MLRLSDVMTREVVTLGPDVSLREALQLFSDHHISGAPVLAGSEIAGVVSVSDLIDVSAMVPAGYAPDRGIARGAATNVLDECTVSEVMTRFPIWKLRPEAPVAAAADCMRQNGIHRILVVDGDRLAGIVTAWDIANAVADNRLTTRTYVFPHDRAADDRTWWTEWLLEEPGSTEF